MTTSKINDNIGPDGDQKSPIIDIHGHIHTPAVQPLIEPYLPPGKTEKKGGGISDPSRRSILTDVGARLEDMDRMGVDMLALSPAPPQIYYRGDSDLALRLAQVQNDHICEIVSGRPDRFVGLGTVPLQDVDKAVKELERAIKDLDLRGLRVNTIINAMELDDPSLDAFYAVAEELEALLFIHPQGFTQPQRLTEYFMSNAVGQPLESTLALSHLIFGGVLERFPKLKVCVAHGGGYFPFYVGRFDQAYKERSECRKHISKPPSAYLQQIYFDTVVFKPESIAFLAQIVGSDKIVMGTDRPYDMSESDPVEFVNSVPDLSEVEKWNILSHTAAQLLRLS